MDRDVVGHQVVHHHHPDVAAGGSLDPDEAEEAHQRHARGEAPQPAPPASDAPFNVVSHDGNAFVIRPRATLGKASVRRTNREVPLLRPGADLSGLPERVRGLGYGAVIDKINNELIDTNMAERDEKSVWYYRVWPELGLGPWPGKGPQDGTAQPKELKEVAFFMQSVT